MSSILAAISGWFWSESIWLPPGFTWKDFGPRPHLFLYSIPLCLVIFCTRIVLERGLFRSVAVGLGVGPAKTRVAATNDVLETVHRNNAELSEKEMRSLSDRLGMTERQIERWLRRRKQMIQKSPIDKFTETMFRWTYYSGALLYGAIVVMSKPWFWDLNQCWIGYPRHPVERDIYYYYLVQLSFYMYLSISQFTDVKRKDFWQMLVHHVTTILLLLFSWTSQFIRIGALILLLHDAVDHWMEAAKICRYLKLQKTCDLLFLFFGATWIITRLVIFPFWILHSTTVQFQNILPMFPAVYLFNALLYVLQCLHIFWTYFLVKAIQRVLVQGKVVDERESSDISDPETSTGLSNNNINNKHFD